jgi:hypothetical protein
MKPNESVTITRGRLQTAASLAAIPSDQVERLWQNLQPCADEAPAPRFDTEHVAYYLGALVIIGAMGWFMTNAWDFLNGWGLAVVAVCYAVLFGLMGRRFWNTPQRRIPGGLLLTAAVCMTPLAIFGVEKATGLWPADDPGSYKRFHPNISGSWVIMEAGTILAGLFMLRKWRFPFLTAPIAYALWFASMDLPELLFYSSPLTWDEKKWFSLVFGLAMLGFTYAADLQRKQTDLAFWGYLFGLLAFWGGLTSMDSGSELGKFFYFLINLGLVGVSLILRRRTFIVFGGLGVFIYLGHLASEVFEDSFAFPFVLSLLGLGIIYLGVLYRRKRDVLEEWTHARILPLFGSLIPPPTIDRLG